MIQISQDNPKDTFNIGIAEINGVDKHIPNQYKIRFHSSSLLKVDKYRRKKKQKDKTFDQKEIEIQLSEILDQHLLYEGNQKEDQGRYSCPPDSVRNSVKGHRKNNKTTSIHQIRLSSTKDITKAKNRTQKEDIYCINQVSPEKTAFRKNEYQLKLETKKLVSFGKKQGDEQRELMKWARNKIKSFNQTNQDSSFANSNTKKESQSFWENNYSNKINLKNISTNNIFNNLQNEVNDFHISKSKKRFTNENFVSSFKIGSKVKKSSHHQSHKRKKVEANQKHKATNKSNLRCFSQISKEDTSQTNSFYKKLPRSNKMSVKRKTRFWQKKHSNKIGSRMTKSFIISSSKNKAKSNISSLQTFNKSSKKSYSRLDKSFNNKYSCNNKSRQYKKKLKSDSKKGMSLFQKGTSSLSNLSPNNSKSNKKMHSIKHNLKNMKSFQKLPVSYSYKEFKKFQQKNKTFNIQLSTSKIINNLKNINRQKTNHDVLKNSKNKKTIQTISFRTMQEGGFYSRHADFGDKYKAIKSNKHIDMSQHLKLKNRDLAKTNIVSIKYEEDSKDHSISEPQNQKQANKNTQNKGSMRILF